MQNNIIIANNIRQNIHSFKNSLTYRQKNNLFATIKNNLQFLRRHRYARLSDLIFQSVKYLISLCEKQIISLYWVRKICYLFSDYCSNFQWITKLEQIIIKYATLIKTKAWKYVKLLAQVRNYANLSLDALEDFVLEHYVITDTQVNFTYLREFNHLIRNKPKFLLALVKQKEYIFDIIIEWFLLSHPELTKYNILL